MWKAASGLSAGSPHVPCGGTGIPNGSLLIAPPMLYLLHHDQVICAAFDFAPFQTSRWFRGQIVHFSTARSPIPATVDYAILGDLTGRAWHVEILGVADPRIGSPVAGCGVTVRILRTLTTDAETLRLISNYATDTAGLLPGSTPLQQLQGAA